MAGLIILGKCSEAADEMRQESNPTNWVMFGYEGRGNELTVQSKGSGGLEEFSEDLNDGRIQFGYLKFQINQTYKFLFVSWCGGGVPEVKKGLFNNHAKEFENWLSKPGRGFHLQINARNEDDLTEKIVLEKLNKVSAFNRATTLKSAAQDKEQAKQQSSQYWQKEKQQDTARKEHLAAHNQSQQQTLAAVKDQEQRRLAAVAKDTIGSMEAQRSQDANEFKAREAERTQQQAKFQEDRRAQIMGEQARTKQSQYTPADYSHGERAAPPPTASRAAAPAPSQAPAPAPKKAPGRLAQPAAFTQPPPAAAPRPGPTKPFKPAPAAPPPVSSAPKPKPPPVAPKPTYREPEPEPEPAYEEPAYQEQAYEEPAYTEPEQTYQEQSYEEPAYQEQEQQYEEPAYQEEQQQQQQQQAYEEPQQTYEEQAAYEEPQQTYDDGSSYQTSQAKALYDYNAEAETDLSFAEGDIINILEDQDPSGWWKGELNGYEGYFPSNFVEKI